jgi:hypothetical protein
MMLLRSRIVMWGVLLVAAFLIGFVPQYVRATRAERELESARQEIIEQRALNTLALAYMQAAQKNYGLAQESVTRFFVEARTLSERTQVPAVRQAVENALAQRDAVTAKLARGEPGVLDDFSGMYMSLLEVTSR